MKWPLKYKLWQKLHGVFNTLAWRIAPLPPGKNAEQSRHILWRLNTWACNHYVNWWIKQVTGKDIPRK